MSAHRRSPRFRGTSFDVEILLRGTTPDVLLQEEDFIISRRTFNPHGLNLTMSGKGYGHASIKWTTHGHKFSDASRKRMSEAWKHRVQHRGWHHTAARKRQWSEQRRGKPALHLRKLSPAQESELYALYMAKPILPGVGLKHPTNGIVLTYDRAFVIHYAAHYGMTPNGLRGVLHRVCSQHNV